MASSDFNVVKNNLEGAVYRGDLNNVTTGGIYTVAVDDTTHFPSGYNPGTMGNLMVIISLTITHQLLFIGNTIIHMRRYIPGYGWSAWAKTTLTLET